MAQEVPLAPGSDNPIDAEHFRTREMSVALRNGVKMGGSLIITWTVAMIVKVRVPLHLGPVRQGHFGFAEGFAGIVFAVLGLGIDTHLIKEVAVRPTYASNVVGGVFALRVLMSLLLFAGMGLFLWETGRPHEVVFAALVFGVTNVLMALNATLGAVLQGVSRVGPAVIANIVTKSAWGIGLLVGLHYDASLPVLALPGLVGEVLRLVILSPASKQIAGHRLRINVAESRAALVESVPYFVNALAIGILGSLGLSVLEYIRHDEREVGWFAAVQNVAYLCMLLSPLLFWVVMPLLARAQARSEEEGMTVFRRCLEALVVTIVPITVLISAGADVLIHIAFGAKYAPATTGLSILSLVFALTYMNTMFAMVLIVLGRGWSVTTISISAVFISAGLTLLFVPLGRHLMGEGGECAGAAAAVIGSETCVFLSMLSRFPIFPLDARNVSAFVKSALLGVLVLLADRPLRRLGIVRLPIEAISYVTLALVIRIFRIRDIGVVIRLLRHRGADVAQPVVVPEH